MKLLNRQGGICLLLFSCCAPLASAQSQYEKVISVVVTNIGLVACKRDVGAAVLAAYVYGLDNNRLWSNLDCAPSNETLVKTFNPGEQVTTEVTWTGMGSAANCPLPRQPIGPGTSARGRQRAHHDHGLRPWEAKRQKERKRG